MCVQIRDGGAGHPLRWQGFPLPPRPARLAPPSKAKKIKLVVERQSCTVEFSTPYRREQDYSMFEFDQFDIFSSKQLCAILLNAKLPSTSAPSRRGDEDVHK